MVKFENPFCWVGMAVFFAFGLSLFAMEVSSDGLFDPAMRGRVVTTSGIVQHAEMMPDGSVALAVHRNVSAFSVVVTGASRVDPAKWEDAEIEVTGVLNTRSGEDGAPNGVIIIASGVNAVKVLSPPPSDPFALPLCDVRELRRTGDVAIHHRIRIGGRVIFSRTIDTSFMVMTDAELVFSVSPSAEYATLPKVGDQVEVCGFVSQTGVTPKMSEALVHVVGHDDAAVPLPLAIALSELVELPRRSETDAESLYGHSVVTEGEIREVNRRAKFMQLFLTEDGYTLLAAVPLDQSIDTPDGLERGARVRVTGNISFYHPSGLLLTDTLEPQNLTLHTSGPEDVTIIRRAPFWTVGRLWALLGAVLFLSLVTFVLVRSYERGQSRAIQRERLRLSHDLHDNLQQLLAATLFRLDAAQNLFEESPSSAKEQLGWAKKAVANTQAGLRQVLWDLQQESEGPASLSGLLRYAISRMPHWRGVVTFEVSGSENIASRNLGGRFLMILQEAVGNALRHGAAKRVGVRLQFRNGLVRLVISDDGCGFNPDDVPGESEGRIGIASMRARATEIGGTFVVRSEPGRGTMIIVEVKNA